MGLSLKIVNILMQAPVNSVLTGPSETVKLFQLMDRDHVLCVVVVDMKLVTLPVLTVLPAHMNPLVRVASAQTVLQGNTLLLLLQGKSRRV